MNMFPLEERSDILLAIFLGRARNINNKAKKITENLPVADRIDKFQEKEAYITTKDHKDGFPDKLSCRLINPCKSRMVKLLK